MLFTPVEFWQHHSSIWLEIQHNKDRFLNSNCQSFVGYCKTQAAKYGIKGTKIAALREALDFLQIADYSKLIAFEDKIRDWVKCVNNEHISIVDIKGPNGKLEPHLQVNNRKIPFHSNFKYARGIFQKIFDEYGQRALLAEKNEGVDWKALMHAVRVAAEAYELLTTGNITFPRPEREILLQIRKGELPYKQVAECIEQGLQNIENVKSCLPPKADLEFIDKFVYDVYKEDILLNICGHCGVDLNGDICYCSWND
jgi:hypothetical protein